MNRKLKSKILLGTIIVTEMFSPISTHSKIKATRESYSFVAQRHMTSQQALNAKLYRSVLMHNHDSIRVLLNQGADPNAEWNYIPMPHLHSVISAAIANDDLNTVILLHRRGLDITRRDFLGFTPLDYARQFNSQNVQRYLEQYLPPHSGNTLNITTQPAA